MKFKNVIIITIVAFVIISALPFTFIFYKQPFSNNIQDWANAASWLSLFISIITTSILFYLTWQIHINEQKRENESKDLIEKLEKPTLVFFCEPSNDSSNIDKWFIKNVGKGPALNIGITHFKLDGNDWIDTLIDCYSLGPQEKPLQLEWLNKTKVNRILVLYNDNLSSKIHAAIGFKDKTHIIEIDKFDSIQDDESKEMINKKTLLGLLKANHKRKKHAIEEVFPPGQINAF